MLGRVSTKPLLLRETGSESNSESEVIEEEDNDVNVVSRVDRESRVDSNESEMDEDEVAIASPPNVRHNTCRYRRKRNENEEVVSKDVHGRLEKMRKDRMKKRRRNNQAWMMRPQL
eukprot:8941139-Ditylum_brightwellii.AAC.2